MSSGLSILEEITGVREKDAYDRLPASIQCTYTRKEWMWLSDQQKVDLVRNECEPETFVDS